MSNTRSQVTVSVILPSFNYARFLSQRIKSILDQTFRDFELIIIDDASTDDSVAIISQFTSDPRVRTVFHETNSGSVYQRWNEGAQMARGRYLWFAGADDYCDADLLETLVNRIVMSPLTGIAFAQSWMVDEIGTKLFRAPVWSRTGTRAGNQARRLLLMDTTIANASAVLLDAEIFRQIGGFDPSYRFASDWKLYLDYLTRSDLDYVAAPMNYCRMHRSTVSLNARRTGEEAVERYRLIDEVCNQCSDLAPLRDVALDREAERSLVQAANQFRKGGITAAVRILSAGEVVDPAHRRRLLKHLPYLGKAIRQKLVSSIGHPSSHL